MSKKRPKQPDISGFFTKIPKMSSDENASQNDVKSEENIEPKMEENQLDFSRNETQDQNHSVENSTKEFEPVIEILEKYHPLESFKFPVTVIGKGDN